MNPDMPVARLRPGGRGEQLRPRGHLVAPGAAATGENTVLREWHALSSTQRKGVWIELVEWVVWLHDRYELATETRLPKCWHLHPGLIEELLALKVWREQIYAAETPSGQAARYWHNELRQVLQAAGSVYAKGCRSGHKPAGALVTADEALQAKWLGGDPLIGVPPTLIKAIDPIAGELVTMSDPEMRAMIDAGLTRPIGAQVGDFQHYEDHWWMQQQGGDRWQQITDPLFITELDASADRMKIADALADDSHRLDEAL